MDFKNDNVLLRYEIRGWKREDPRIQLIILKTGNAVFYRTEETRRDPDGPDIFVPISDKAMDAVRKILSEERLYHLDKTENPAENWGCFHIYDFFFAGNGRMASYNGVDLEHIVGKAGYPKVSYLFEVMARLGEILIPEGVPAVCFVPGKKLMSDPVRTTGQRVTDSFVIYDFRGVKTARMFGESEQNQRLERYAFVKQQDGTFALEVQVGWPGGTSHWDGAGNTFALPSEWFEGGFDQFLDILVGKYPAKVYGVGREELAGFPGLKDFLGASGDGSH